MGSETGQDKQPIKAGFSSHLLLVQTAAYSHRGTLGPRKDTSLRIVPPEG